MTSIHNGNEHYILLKSKEKEQKSEYERLRPEILSLYLYPVGKYVKNKKKSKYVRRAAIITNCNLCRNRADSDLLFFGSDIISIFVSNQDNEMRITCKTFCPAAE